MPRATDELRARWGGLHGVGDDKATEHLTQKGFSFSQGTIRPPIGYDHTRDSEDTEGAIDFLCDEWDYAYEATPLGEQAKKPR